MENVLARVFLLIGAALLIAACAGYKEYTVPDWQQAEGEREFQKTGQPSELPDWRKQCDGAIP